MLHTLYASIYVPDAVVLELDMGRLLRSDTFDPREHAWAEVVPVSAQTIEALPANRLGSGERATIAYAQAQRAAYASRAVLVGLDDRQVREMAESLGLRVTGTLGILLRALRAGLIDRMRPHLNALVQQGFHLSSDLYDSVLAPADEAT